MSVMFALASPAGADETPSMEVVQQAAVSEVVLLGEVHDNPAHHHAQAALIAKLAPRAVVWEMLTAQQVAQLTPEALQDPAGLGDILAWEASGWPDYTMYQPVFEASAAARHYGAAVTRPEARAAMQQGIADMFGAEAGVFGLDQPLPPKEQAAREAMQHEAHCGALPAEYLPQMVDIQRLRDARMAKSVLRAVQETGGPVAVITGNGHARKDFGIAVYLAKAAPDLAVFALGQAEAGVVNGVFDAVLDAEAVARPDPCLAFQ